MGRWIMRGVGTIAVLAVVAFGACRLLPERFAVNVPLANVLFGSSAEPPTAEQVDRQIRVPEGLAIAVYAELPKIRALRPTPAGDLLASVPREGKVVLLERDANGDGRSDGTRTLLEGLNRPHGMDLHDGWLYVGETDAIGRVRFDPATRAVSGSFERIVTELPGGGNHWTRTVRIGPDGWLYVSIGSSCNVCVEEDARRAAMLRFRPDGSAGETFATGLRNSVGFDWRPDGGELYATDNGRDLLGDDFPPCELNRIVKGGFYGWPFANGQRQPDPDLGPGREKEIATSIPPAHGFRAHNAPLGIAFLTSALAPSLPRGTAIVALHGSWNRTKKDGYKVVALHFEADGTIRETDFVTGLLVDDEVTGRPVDVVQGADGAVYVSDDYAGVVYRVAPTAGASAAAAATAAAAARALATDPLGGVPPAELAAASARGRALYEGNACFGCHEPARAQSGVVPKPLGALRERYDIPGMVEFLAAPTPPMPAFALSDTERRDLSIWLLANH